MCHVDKHANHDRVASWWRHFAGSGFLDVSTDISQIHRFELCPVDVWQFAVEDCCQVQVIFDTLKNLVCRFQMTLTRQATVG